MATEQINIYDPADNSPEALMDTVDEQRTGYVALSLTNYTSTSVPAIAIGSEIEINGALFKTLNANDPVTVGGVTDGTVYILATPSGVSPDQIVTFSFTATAPTWFDSKQGFYNAGGTARYVDFKMEKSGASYSNKRQFATNQDTDVSISAGGELVADSTIRVDEGISYDGSGSLYIKIQEIPISPWDMVTIDTRNIGYVSYGIAKNDIISVDLLIRNDDDTERYPGVMSNSVDITTGSPGTRSIWIDKISTTSIFIRRRDSSLFDSTDFNATIDDRGWLYVTYKA